MPRDRRPRDRDHDRRAHDDTDATRPTVRTTTRTRRDHHQPRDRRAPGAGRRARGGATPAAPRLRSGTLSRIFAHFCSCLTLPFCASSLYCSCAFVLAAWSSLPRALDSYRIPGVLTLILGHFMARLFYLRNSYYAAHFTSYAFALCWDFPYVATFCAQALTFLWVMLYYG